MDISTLGAPCEQCGFLHPPIPAGERCPLAKKEIKNLSEDDVRIFCANIQNMILFHLEKKKIEDPKKVFQEITLLVSNYLEKL